MRTTIRLDEHLLTEAKVLAAETGTTLTEVIEDALRERLARRAQFREKREWVSLPTYGGQGVQPDVDLSSYAALLDVMDKADDSDGR